MALPLPGTGFLIGASISSAVNWVDASNALVKNDSVATYVLPSTGAISDDFIYNPPSPVWRLSSKFSLIQASGNFLYGANVRARATYVGDANNSVKLSACLEYRDTGGNVTQGPIDTVNLQQSSLTTFNLQVWARRFNPIDYDFLSEIKLVVFFEASLIIGPATCKLAWADASLVFQRENFSLTLTGQGSN